MSEGRGAARPVAEVVAELDREDLVELLVSAADWHEDVERSVRMLAARSAGDLGEMKAQVDRALRTRRLLGYRAGPMTT